MSDVDDDGDEVAIDGDMEPASTTGDVPESDDDYDDGDDAVAAGGAIARTMDAPRGTRPISEKTRELAKKIAEANRSKVARGEHDLPDDDDLDVQYDEQPTGAPAAPSSEKAAAAPVATPQGQPPPSPQLDPEVAKLREDYTRRMAEVDAREQRLAEAERSGDLAKLADSYFEHGAPAIVELLKKWEGVEGEALKDALADLVSDLTIHMGVDVPQEIRDRLESKRTRKQVQRMRSEQARQQSDAESRMKAAQEAENQVRIKGILQQEINKPEHAPNYPWLTSEPNAGEIVYDVVEYALKKDGTKLTWQEGAKRANDYLQQQSLAWYDKRKHLLTTAPGQGDHANGKMQRSQGDPQVRRSQAPPPKPPAPPPPTTKWDPEAHRRHVKAKYRTAFSRQDED